MDANLVTIVSLFAGALLAPFCGYLAFLALLAKRPPASPGSPGLTRFAIVMPAHDEERDIAQSVRGLLALDYPVARRRIVVVADNCSDQTAQRAYEAGAEVWAREDPARRGKGYALEYAFRRLLEEGAIDAVVVVDADTAASPNLLRVFEHHLAHGAAAVQVEYGVRNVDASWRTRLMALALALIHGVRSSARERLGLSAGLRGNGMCFTRELLEAHPHEAHGLVEDVEYGVKLGLHGVRVAFAGEAHVWGEMASSGTAAATQRRRWEGGRLQLVREQALPLLLRALRARDRVALDLLMDLLVPPFGYLGLAVFTGLSLEGVRSAASGAVTAGLVVWGALALCVAVYLGRGLAWSGLGASGLVALAWAPAYVVWKLIRVRPWRAERAWIRTRRASEPAAAASPRESPS